MKSSNKIILTIAGLLFAGCTSETSVSEDSSTLVVSATKPSSVVKSLSNKISEVGTNMNAAMSGVSSSSVSSLGSIDSKCGIHGEPLFNPLKSDEASCVATGSGYWESTSGECKMPTTDPAYTGMKFFCFIAKDTGSPDSLQGAFGLFGKLSCSLEKQGMQWDGVKRTLNMTLSEGNGCFKAGELVNGPCDGLSSCSMAVDVTASSLSGEYYDSSLDIEIGSDMYYRAKVKVSNGITELAVSNNGQGVVNNEDVYAVTLDETNNRFAYEGRFDRIDALGCGGSCGWSRHYRMLLDLVDGTDEIIPESIQAVISDLYSYGGNYYSFLNTVKGSMTSGTGLTGYLYSGYGTNLADVIDAGQISTISTSCFALGSDSVAGVCSGNLGITAGTGTLAFFLPGGSYKSQTTAVNKYLDGDVWFANIAGLNFTSVGLSPEE